MIDMLRDMVYDFQLRQAIQRIADGQAQLYLPNKSLLASPDELAWTRRIRSMGVEERYELDFGRKKGV
jgi:hypothetical protein